LYRLDPSDRSEYKARVEEAKQDYKSERHNALAEEEGYGEKRFQMEAAGEAQEAAKKALSNAKKPNSNIGLLKSKESSSCWLAMWCPKKSTTASLPNINPLKLLVEEAAARGRQADR